MILSFFGGLALGGCLGVLIMCLFYMGQDRERQTHLQRVDDIMEKMHDDLLGLLNDCPNRPKEKVWDGGLWYPLGRGFGNS